MGKRKALRIRETDTRCRAIIYCTAPKSECRVLFSGVIRGKRTKLYSIQKTKVKYSNRL
jgi:hypothetical protein